MATVRADPGEALYSLRMVSSFAALSPVLSIGIVVILWQIVAVISASILVPSPLQVAETGFRLVMALNTWLHLAASVFRVSLGFVASVLLAFLTAALWMRLSVTRRLSRPAHEFIRYIPVPAFVPLMTAWLGIGQATKVALIFVGTYFQLVFLFFDDFTAVPIEYTDIGRCLGLSRLRLFWRVHVPAALPALLNSGRIAFAWAWSYLLVAEVVNSRIGIGFLVLQAYRTLDMARMVALIILIGLFGLAADLLFRKGRLAICPWVSRGSRRDEPEQA